MNSPSLFPLNNRLFECKGSLVHYECLDAGLSIMILVYRMYLHLPCNDYNLLLLFFIISDKYY